MATPDRVKELRRRFAKAIPEPECELRFETPWQLLIATILSAQSTDATVNRVTPQLFRRWPTPEKLGRARQDAVEKVVKSTGFFRNKAKAIRAASQKVTEEHAGEVPRDMDEMCSLPGVARKTANLVLGTAYGIPSGILVDTHARRVAQRLELTQATDPVEVERDLCAVFPKRSWIDTGHRLVLHGRYVCKSRAPLCAGCPLNEVCPSAESAAEGRWTERARSEAALVG